MKLHLGCGKRFIPGFVHIDLDDHPHIDHFHDIRSLPMIDDEKCELIYCAHSLEYFDRFEAVTILREWYNKLEVGGVLRLAVPDFEALTEVYRKTGDLLKVIGPLYGRMKIVSDGQESYIYHKTVYDFNLLKSVLEEAGFTDVKRYDWRKTVHADYDDHSQAYYPHMDKDKGILVSLNVEARKGVEK